MLCRVESRLQEYRAKWKKSLIEPGYSLGDSRTVVAAEGDRDHTEQRLRLEVLRDNVQGGREDGEGQGVVSSTWMNRTDAHRGSHSS